MLHIVPGLIRSSTLLRLANNRLCHNVARPIVIGDRLFHTKRRPNVIGEISFSHKAGYQCLICQKEKLQ